MRKVYICKNIQIKNCIHKRETIQIILAILFIRLHIYVCVCACVAEMYSAFIYPIMVLLCQIFIQKLLQKYNFSFKESHLQWFLTLKRQ